MRISLLRKAEESKMPSNMLIKSALFGLVLLPFLSLAAEKATPAVPATPAMPATPAVPAEKETIFGSQLMTAEERTAFRTQMQNATTEEDRQKIRLEHHTLMLERAKAKGVTLSDTPMMNGQGMGNGKATGMGMGGGMMNNNGKGSGKAKN
jgi:hypothetical protein